MDSHFLAELQFLLEDFSLEWENYNKAANLIVILMDEAERDGDARSSHLLFRCRTNLERLYTISDQRAKSYYEHCITSDLNALASKISSGVH